MTPPQLYYYYYYYIIIIYYIQLDSIQMSSTRSIYVDKGGNIEQHTIIAFWKLDITNCYMIHDCCQSYQQCYDSNLPQLHSRLGQSQTDSITEW